MDSSFLYDKKLLVGGVYDYLDLSNDDGEEVRVSTLRVAKGDRSRVLPINKCIN